MQHIRVAMIAPPWLPVPPEGYGGIENVIAVLVPALRRLGVKVEVFTIAESRIRSNKKHWLYRQSQYTAIRKPYYDALPILVAHISKALNYIREDGHFDLIHDHNPYIGPAMLAYAGADLPPIIHTLHGPPFATEEQLKLGIPDNRLMWRQLAHGNKVNYINISHAATPSIPRRLRKSLLGTVHNGIDTKQFPFNDKKDDYFITLARFHPNKGQALAVKASLAQGFRLRMAGPVGDLGRPKQILLELANPLSSYRNLIDFRYFSDNIFPSLEDGQIEYVGDLSGKNKLRFISQAKALLFPIQWEEPFGMAVIEALACGTPVVAMNRGAMAEIIDHGRNGFLANNYRQFAAFIKRIDEIDPAICRQSVQNKFSDEVMAKHYLKFYSKLLAGS